MDAVQNRKKEVALNLQIGQLVLSPAGTVQFKSLTVAEALNKAQAMSGTASVRLTEASLKGLGDKKGSRNNSQKNLDDRSIAERSINYMQQRQSTASVGSRARRQMLAHNNSAQKTGDQIFGTPNVNDRKSVAGKLEGATEDAPYF